MAAPAPANLELCSIRLALSFWHSNILKPLGFKPQSSQLWAARTCPAANLAWSNCCGASEKGFKGRRCGGCHLVRFCNEACRAAD